MYQLITKAIMPLIDLLCLSSKKTSTAIRVRILNGLTNRIHLTKLWSSKNALNLLVDKDLRVDLRVEKGLQEDLQEEKDHQEDPQAEKGLQEDHQDDRDHLVKEEEDEM